MRRVALPLLTVLATAAVAVPAAAPADARPHHPVSARAGSGGDRSIRLHTWDSGAQWRQGSLDGTAVQGGRLVFDQATGTTSYAGRSYDRATWTSPWVEPGFSFQNLIPSWSALTDGDTWIGVEVRGRTASGDATSWDLMARWKAGHLHLKRSSVSGQPDDGTTVNVDTWVTDGLADYQLRLELMRRTGTAATPSLDLATAMASRIPDHAGPTSAPGVARGKVLPVPRYSQMAHVGHFPAYGGGGEAWCSPTSTSMVLGYYDALPAAKRYTWVPSSDPAPWVDYAARATYDHDYDGTGNWPFNTAYAAPLAGKAFVTRLRSLAEAEKLVKAGIPVVASIAFGPGELDGAPISSSNGHLVVIVGFRDNGDPVVNDPAAATKSGVRRTYDRGQFEKVWLDASGGMAYVIHDKAHPLPHPGKHSNW
ncbi:C39 family peptidase [Nocardioides panacisoli]|uniref:Peptidase C39 family protein n=1 Tax=Nocardioides panacisoli TaxID=627624 RepID=A0ABP7IXI9_9ACTN